MNPLAPARIPLAMRSHSRRKCGERPQMGLPLALLCTFDAYKKSACCCSVSIWSERADFLDEKIEA